jgi:hypothetical protein
VASWLSLTCLCHCNSVACYFCSSNKNISQDQLEGLQQAASHLPGSSTLPDTDEHLRPTVQVLLAAMKALNRLLVTLEAPGPLAFHHVRQVRGSMLLLDMAAVLVGQPATCEFVNLVRHDSNAKDLMVTGAQYGCRFACTWAAGGPACLLCMVSCW